MEVELLGMLLWFAFGCIVLATFYFTVAKGCNTTTNCSNNSRQEWSLKYDCEKEKTEQHRLTLETHRLMNEREAARRTDPA